MKQTAEQSAIVDADVNEDLLVVAGAGSGKTMTMTSRIIALIRRGVPSEQILGLTFTRKAASELQSRVGAAVIRRDQGRGASGVDPERNFLKPTVSTYDAFFQSIVRQYGLLVGMDQDTRPLSSAGAYQLASQVVADHLDLIFPAGSSAQDGDSDDLGSATFSTTVNRVLGLTGAVTTSMISSDCPDFDQAVERIRAWDRAFVDRADQLIGDQPVPATEPTVSTSPPKRSKKETDEHYQGKIKDFRDKRRSIRLYRVDTMRRAVLTREKLLTLVQDYQRAKRQANMAEFGDFTLAAFQLVERFPSISAQLRRRYSHVFLDEYQDTSTTQALLLAAIFHPQRLKEDQGSADQAPGRSAVTAVGDPFQSIYAWRGASPGAFRTFQAQFGMLADRPDSGSGPLSGVTAFGRSQDQDPLTLSRTFRNSSWVLKAANQLTVPLRHRGQESRSEAELREVDVARLRPREDADPGTVGLLGYSTGGQEIDGVVRFALRARELYGNQGDAPHVAVLFRSKAALPRYRQALEAAGLSCQIVGYSSLFDRPEVMDLRALLSLICDHTDSDSLMRLLASARFGMDAADLSALASLAAKVNEDSQYRALVRAGLVESDSDPRRRREDLHRYRDQVPNDVFLVDLLLRDDLPDLLENSGLSPRGRVLAAEAARVICQVQAESSAPLRQVVIAAIRALDLDVDLVLARSLANPERPLEPSQAKAGIQALLDQVDVYLSELPQGLGPSLRGFVSWLSSLDQSPEMPTDGDDRRADVALMTVHQAKGLEWDAVAVVGLKRGAFPSSQGDRLTVKPALDQPVVQSPDGPVYQYNCTARTWLVDPQSVPVPVRADAMILPRFPHDAPLGADPEDLLGRLDLTSLEEEAMGLSRESGMDDQARPVRADAIAPSQREQYGRRLLDDERRLIYVAATRARHDLLLTFSQDSQAEAAALNTPAPDPDKASNFWTELVELFQEEPDAVKLEQTEDAQEGQPTPPLGLFVGEHAQSYRQATVDRALEEVDQVAARDGQRDQALWPPVLNARTRAALNRSAAWVRAGEPGDPAMPEEGDDGLYANAVRVLQVSTGRLGVADDQLLTDLDLLRRTGRRILGHGASSVTAIQAGSAGGDPKMERDYWQGLVRPIPQVASPQAEAGTRFHDWARRFILPEISAPQGLVDLPDQAEAPNLLDGPLGPGAMAERARMLAGLDQERESLDSKADPVKARLLTWEQRLAESDWAERTPVWVERPIVAVLAGSIVKGKLDAVFAGGLDPDRPDLRYTIVDWKTGARPHGEESTNRRLVQLDFYRLLLSRLEGIGLSTIDACLYYVSEDRPQDRLIRARARTEEEILATLAEGIPEQSDED